MPWPASISPSSFAALQRETGMTAKQIAAAVGTPLRITDSEYGLSAREQQAAIDGADVGAIDAR
jgi:hypothetical protein